MSSLPAHALEIDPESSLQFTITRDPAKDGSDGSSRCTMTLRHTGNTKGYLAFKVKTTQPRRYLVRPNQGIVAPNSSETVSILLVDKDRQVLWSSYDRLGQSALDHSKDKFLVQSCAVSEEFSAKFANEPRITMGEGQGGGGGGGQYKKELVEELTAMWNKASSNSNLPVYNKKLHVRHVVDTGATSAAGAGGGAATANSNNSSLPASFQEGVDKRNNADKMSPEQLTDEVASLRRKYDELVAFSVNLTAERDILNNTLEQTKRDLNREMATRTALEKQGLKVGGSRSSQDSKSGKSSGGVSVKTLWIVVVVACLSAIRATNLGSLDGLGSVPVLGGMLGFDSPTTETTIVRSGSDEL
eukprot:CAMPEP_0201729690 /NCGR_PEP_ID=MMETSP0593-20130828/19741_1 /ASSEMBLY_ACC=CAM_ASM_000672 /TAXON_ID=267983 /ORGANISM="Skeletonema japonicum, Strain CCMP2506" /LENGTH=357 /DNA_ID=CAMNT_0048222075 /DNA_START=19 /DNA_END=1092 /DNA_ORIENTATION=+